MEEIKKLLETWKKEKGSFIPNAPIYGMFIKELEYAIERQEQLTTHVVSQQRELLIDFSMKRNKAPKDYRPQYEKEVDGYLKSINCG